MSEVFKFIYIIWKLVDLNTYLTCCVWIKIWSLLHTFQLMLFLFCVGAFHMKSTVYLPKDFVNSLTFTVAFNFLSSVSLYFACSIVCTRSYACVFKIIHSSTFSIFNRCCRTRYVTSIKWPVLWSLLEMEIEEFIHRWLGSLTISFIIFTCLAQVRSFTREIRGIVRPAVAGTGPYGSPYVITIHTGSQRAEIKGRCSSYHPEIHFCMQISSNNAECLNNFKANWG